MSSITCATCNEVFSNDDITKHLTATRHKTVKYNKTGEVIECESCDNNNNIHQLQILRFGLNDLSLLCVDCLGKQEAPDATYTLNNGSFFKKIDQYCKYRDIECQICGNDKKLFVGNGKDKQHIVCKNCLPAYQEENKSVKFVSEDSDTFLSELLGLTQFVPKKNAGKRKGRGAMKKGRRAKTLTPKMEKEAQERREFYFNKIKETKEIRGGSIVKAIGVDEIGKQLKDTKISKGPSFGKSPQKGGSKGPGGKGKGAGSKPGSHSSSRNGSKPNSTHSSKPNSNANSTHASRSATPVPQAPRHTEKPERRSEQSKKGGKEASKPDKSGKKGSDKGNKTEGPDSKPNEKSGKPKNEKAGKAASKSNTTTSKDKSSKDKPSKNGEKVGKVKEEEILSPYEQTLQPYPLPKDPPLRYDNLNSYYQEMSQNLFLEEQFGVSTGENKYLEPTEFSIGWFQEHNKKYKSFFIEIELTDEFKKKHLQARLIKFRRSPFAVDQAMFLVYNDVYPWFGKIILNESVQIKRGRKEKLELVVELYPWNTSRLPFDVNIKKLKLLPASVPISRVFYAMDRLNNPKFQKLLLGHEPIPQLVFNNYVKLSPGSRFNDSQKVALQSVLNNSVTVLQGPPGTGKTSTIHEIILQLLTNFNTYPILVVAASNIAIDNIAEKMLATHEKSILRIVSSSKEVDYDESHKLGGICLHNKMYGMLPQQMKDTIRTLRSPRADTVSMNQHKKLRMKQYELSNTLVAQARVIFTTSVVAGGGYLKSIPKFPVVIMDEATQSSEPITLIPLSMPGVTKFVFVGDQKQLSSFTQVPNLSLSLFERVLLNGTYKTPHMLDTQYRMHPDISEFPRNRFYQGQLKDGLTAEDRSKYPIKRAVEFWDTKGKCPESRVRTFTREDHGYTYDNKGEISYILEVLVKLILEKNIDRKDIGIITPYRGQRDLISKRLSENDIINPTKEEIHVEIDRDDIDSDTKPVTIHMVNDIMIASIDAFQGREKDFIIFSCVRSNSDNKIGFLNDERRLNVALTRARYGLVLIGDYNCLNHDPLWCQYLDHLSSKGSINKSDKFDM